MTNFNADTTLGNIVTALPSLARTLESHGLDYCCGGAATLRDACAEREIDPFMVLNELTEAAASSDEEAPDWASFDVVEMIDHLESTHHQYLNAELPRLTELSKKVLSVHGDNHPELAEIDKCYAEIRADLEPHLLKEEQVLFPMARELTAATTAPQFHCGSLRNPVSKMMMEHDDVGSLLERLRSLTSDFQLPADACPSYTALFTGLEALEADTHMHVHKENNVLFPAIVELESRFEPAT